MTKVLTTFLVALAFALAFAMSSASVAHADGPLVVDLYDTNGDALNAYNLVVDSNVTAPSTYAPSVATVIVRFCNTGTTTLDNVWGYIGDYKGSASASTPGIYPTRYVTDTGFTTQHPALTNPGSYAFTHIGGDIGTADASRYIGSLAPGQCKVQYWHFSYPQCENNADGSADLPACENSPAWGESVKPEDDLWLNFDVWTTAGGGFEDNATWTMTMRNEISAMANKIEPNPSGRWFNTNTSVIQPGDVITSNGVLYRFGNANQGFDNDGDYVPDYNAWAQPIGDAGYDPSCFRLIRTTGVLTVSRSSGNPDMILNFTDKLYFMNLPPDNTDVIGEVRYVFQALNGPCFTSMTPYQEVASGSDNEKFNGDFGAGIPPLQSQAPAVAIDKAGNVSVQPGATMSYTVQLDNQGSADAGLPLYSMPLVIEDTIPVSTTFTGDIVVPGYTILYSIDGGQTYTTTKPSPTSDVTDIQLWMNDSLAASAQSSFTFSVTVAGASSNPPPVIENCADVGFGQATPFAQDCVNTLVEGTNLIGDRVWKDDNSDGIQNTTEISISNVTLTLYWDADGDGELDTDVDQFVITTTSITGYYEFGDLPNGDFLVVVDDTDPDLPFGYSATTPIVHAVTGLGTTNTSPYREADFGFGPVLVVDKRLDSGSPAYEGQLVTYTITLANTRPGVGDSGFCEYTVWAGEYNPSGDSPETEAPPWVSPENAVGRPDGQYATLSMNSNTDDLALGQFHIGEQAGNIQDVKVVFYFREKADFTGSGGSQDDRLTFNLYVGDAITGTTQPLATYDTTFFTLTAPSSYIAEVNLTGENPWTWSDFTSDYTEILLTGDKGNVNPHGEIGVDAVAFVITTDSTDCGGDSTIATLPLTDTYDANKLTFQYALPPHDSTSTNTSPYANTGLITWDNLGPLYGGQTKDVTVVFEALEPTGSSETITNTATVTHATFTNGRPVHGAEDSVTTTLQATGLISGVVWSDADNDGWSSEIGAVYGYDGSDFFIPGVKATLYACIDDDTGDPVYTGASTNRSCSQNNGTWTAIATQYTDSSGQYAFDGLLDGYYYVAIDTTTLPSGTWTLRGDPNALGTGGQTCTGVAGTCDNLWAPDSTPTGNDLNTFNALDNAENLTDKNFGYNGNPMIYGTVWHDVDGDGIRESGEDGLDNGVGSSRVDLQACKLEYSIVSPK